jgi:arylsulfatase A-like enzyme
MTDRAITVGREHDPDRLLVHYMQPHEPYIAEALESKEPLDPRWKNPIEQLQQGNLDRETVWEAYLDNLRVVLDEVERLLENVDAERVVITADHGEAFGEYGFYEHPIGCPHPVVKQVPWATTTAVDRGTSTPAAYERDETAPEVSDRLEDLGYV